MEALPILDEAGGIGAVRFGMNPSQVRDVMGQHETWEEWMNGNVNASLCYPGIILFFDEHCSEGPTADSKLEHIEVRPTFKAQWRGVELSRLTRDMVERSLGSGASLRQMAEGRCQLTAKRVRALFTSSGALIYFAFGAWYDA